MSSADATRGVIRSHNECSRCSQRTRVPSSDGDAALESAVPGGRRGTSRKGAGGRGVTRVYLLQGAGQPPVATRPAFARGAKFQPTVSRPARTRTGWQRAVWATPYPTRKRSARASETQTAAAFVWFSTRRIRTLRSTCLSMFPRKASRLSLPIAASAITASTKQTRISMFSLSLSRRQWAGCTAAQAKPSRHDKTIVVQPCSHPMPSPILEKVRKK